MTTVRVVGRSNRKQLGVLNFKGVFGRQWLAYRIEWEVGKLVFLEMAGSQKHLVGKTMPLGSWP